MFSLKSLWDINDFSRFMYNSYTIRDLSINKSDMTIGLCILLVTLD